MNITSVILCMNTIITMYFKNESILFMKKKDIIITTGSHESARSALLVFSTKQYSTFIRN